MTKRKEKEIISREKMMDISMILEPDLVTTMKY